MFKQKSIFRFSLLALSASFFVACQKSEETAPEDNREYKFINLLVSDNTTNRLSLITPQTNKMSAFNAKFVKSALYTTESGRFAVIIHRADNTVETFDTGFERHSDHVDVKGTPKFGAFVGNSALPTHFKSHGSEVAVFNDGDGTLSIANENDFHTAGIQLKTIQTGNKAHHGAMAKFDNGNYAITEKDGSVAGSLPERVKIMDTNGKTLHVSTVQTKGIHGNATNGKVAIFGSASGVLVVNNDGTQKLIPHPTDFGTAWFGTILEAAQANKFIGYTAAKGAYFIDATTDKITPIITSTDIMQCKVDYAGANLIVLLHSGELHIYNLANGLLKAKDVVIGATEKTSTTKPQLVATQKYIYITQPNTGEVLQVQSSNLKSITKLAVGGSPSSITIVGTETSKGHD
jgi:hypothetical protein